MLPDFESWDTVCISLGSCGHSGACLGMTWGRPGCRLLRLDRFHRDSLFPASSGAIVVRLARRPALMD